MRVFIVMGYPIAGWFITEHLFLTWMMKSGTPWYPYFRKAPYVLVVYGGFLKWSYLKTTGFNTEMLSFWMIQGFPHFRKRPYIYIHTYIHTYIYIIVTADHESRSVWSHLSLNIYSNNIGLFQEIAMKPTKSSYWCLTQGIFRNDPFHH